MQAKFWDAPPLMQMRETSFGTGGNSKTSSLNFAPEAESETVVEGDEEDDGVETEGLGVHDEGGML
jgi:hypothetical protein